MAKVVEVNENAIGYSYMSCIVLSSLVELIITFVSKYICSEVYVQF